MLKDTLNKGISTPIAIGIILILVVLVGSFTWLQYGEMWREAGELPEIELPEKKECSKEEDCILRDVVVNEPCSPCDNSSPEYQCVSIEEAKRIHEEQKEKYGILPCTPCPPESIGDKRFKCICEGGECVKIEDETTDWQSCSEDSDCICCDGFSIEEEGEKKSYSDICVNKDFSAGCKILFYMGAFSNTHYCKCENNKCVAVMKGETANWKTPTFVIENSKDLVGKEISVKGIAFETEPARCTLMACPFGNPCCNHCAASLGLKDDNNFIVLSGKHEGTKVGCEGNECNLDCYPLKEEKTYIVTGTWDGNSLDLISFVEDKILAPDWRACSVDEQCVSVDAGYCGCTGGGKATAINKTYKEAWEKKLLIGRKEFYCPAVMSLHPSCSKEPKCIEGLCSLE